ncbi:MAG: hypothetical protein ACOX3W_07935 [Christensenellaceae bacterium]
MKNRKRKVFIGWLLIVCLLFVACGEKSVEEPIVIAPTLPAEASEIPYGACNQRLYSIQFWVPEDMEKQKEDSESINFQSEATLTVTRKDELIRGLFDMEEHIQDRAGSLNASVIYEGIFHTDGKGVYEVMFDAPKGEVLERILVVEGEIYEFTYTAQGDLSKEQVGMLNAIMDSVVIDDPGHEKVYSAFEILPYKPNTSVYGQGKYTAGKDIPPGDCFLVSALPIPGGGGYYSLAKSESKKFSDVLSNEAVGTFSIVSVQKGDFLEVKNLEFFLLDVYLQAAPFAIEGEIGRDGTGWISGVYRVGDMIGVGEYHLRSLSSGVKKAYVYEECRTKKVVDDIYFDDTYDVSLVEGQYIYIWYVQMSAK